MAHPKTFFTRYLSGFTFLCLFIQIASANPVEEHTARRIASRFLSSLQSLRTDTDLNLVYSGDPHPQSALRGDQTTALYYIYTIGETNGFVIVSGEDKAYPILGYADQGTFRVEQMPENLAYWLNLYKDELRFAAHQKEEASADVQSQWDAFLREQPSPSITGMVLPTAHWDQGSPYNDLCPQDSLGKTSVTGCVATAMGIAMKHYNWPDRGVGSHSYKTRTDSIPVSASFNVAYNWQDMLNTYEKIGNVPNWTAAQSEAVATLLFHCGVSVEMKYASTSSGAYTTNVVSALVDNFKYDKSLSLIYRELYSTGEWRSLMREELDNNRPVVYGGATEDLKGHLFIMDGYSYSGDYFHINWGWNGYSNGYYLLSSLQPSWQGIGGNAEGAGYSHWQDAIVGMKKAESGSYTNNELYLYCPLSKEEDENIGIYTDVERIETNKPFLFFYTYILDYGDRDFYGELAIGLEDKNNNLKEILHVLKEEKPLPAGWYYYDNKGVSLTIENEVEEGDMIRLYYRPEGYNWRPLRGEPGAVSQLPVYAEATGNIQLPTLDVQLSTTNGELRIDFPQDVTLQDFTLYSLPGRKMMQKSFHSTISPVITPLSGVGNGLYIITIRTSEGLISRKVRLPH